MIGDNSLSWDALECREDPEALVAAALKLGQELPLLQPGSSFEHAQAPPAPAKQMLVRCCMKSPAQAIPKLWPAAPAAAWPSNPKTLNPKASASSWPLGLGA